MKKIGVEERRARLARRHHLAAAARASDAAAVDAAADRLGQWFGGARIVPRFPSPLHHELSS